jgi:hypothetical protein
MMDIEWKGGWLVVMEKDQSFWPCCIHMYVEDGDQKLDVEAQRWLAGTEQS